LQGVAALAVGLVSRVRPVVRSERSRLRFMWVKRRGYRMHKRATPVACYSRAGLPPPRTDAEVSCAEIVATLDEG